MDLCQRSTVADGCGSVAEYSFLSTRNALCGFATNEALMISYHLLADPGRERRSGSCNSYIKRHVDARRSRLLTINVNLGFPPRFRDWTDPRWRRHSASRTILVILDYVDLGWVIVLLLAFLVYQETHAPIVLQRKVTRLGEVASQRFISRRK